MMEWPEHFPKQIETFAECEVPVVFYCGGKVRTAKEARISMQMSEECAAELTAMFKETCALEFEFADPITQEPRVYWMTELPRHEDGMAYMTWLWEIQEK